MKNDLLHFSTALLATLVLATGCSKQTTTEQLLSERKLPVVTQAVAPDTFRRTVTVQGTLAPVNSATISARIAGPLLSVDVDLGDTVKAGKTKLFEVDPVNVENAAISAREALGIAEAQVVVAEAQLVKAQAVSDKAQLDAARYERLHKERRVSANEYENAQLNARTAKADAATAEATLQLRKQEVSQAKAQLTMSERQLSDATLYAPIDGVVNQRHCEPGELVSPGASVLVIDGTEQLKALAFLPAKYYAEIIPGETRVTLSVNGQRLPSLPIAAKTSAMQPKMRVFEIKALLPGSEQIVAGDLADFEILLETRQGLSVPETAVVNRAAGSIVFVDAGKGVAEERLVKTGLRTEGRVELLNGVKAGEKVIIQGQTQLYDGRAIQEPTP